MSNLVLNSKTYTGDGYISPGLSQWQNYTGGIPAGFATLQSSVRFSGSKYRPKWDLGYPVIATEDSSCACTGAVLRRGDVTINVRFDPGMTLAERTDIADQLSDLVASTQFRATLINLQPQT